MPTGSRPKPAAFRSFRVTGLTGFLAAIKSVFTVYVWAVIASIVLIYPGFGTNWFGQHGNPDSSLPVGFTRGQFEMSQIIPLAILLVVGILFYVAGAPTRRHAVKVPIAQEMGIGEATGAAPAATDADI